jgi:transposase InsO family protein
MRGLRVRFEEGRLPSFRTLQRWMADWRAKNAQLDLFVNHPDAWRSRYKAAGGNAAADVHGINDRWEIDSTKADLLLSDGRRHVIVGVIDVWTRRLKLLVSRSSSSEAVCGLLRRSLLDWGVPKIVRSDNGSDYVSARVRAVLVGLDIHQDMAPPYTPEHKPFIERAFGTFNHDLMELLPGYVGHDVAERKAIESRKSFAQRMMTEGERLDIRMTAAELQDFCDRWADSLYAHEPHSGLDGATPFARAASWTAPLRRIENERALDVLLAEPVTRDGLTVGKKGLKINRHTYDAPELGGLEGQRVTARWDETDMARVHVFDDSGAYVGMAVCPELADLAGVGVTRQQITAERKVRQRKVMADGKRELRKIANKVGVADIAREIISEAARASRKVIDLPRPSITHSTPALSEAARATARPVTPDLTPAQARLQAEIAADLSAAKTAAAPRSPATVVALGSPEARFARALEIEARQARGEEVADADARWLSRYRNQPEYRTGKLMQEDFKSVGYVPVTA